MYMVYFAAIVAGSFLIALFARSLPMRRLGGLGQPLPNPIGFIIPAALFGTFSGLRNNLGDTVFYIHSYNLIDPETAEEVTFRFEGGIMYPLIQYWCRMRSEDPYQLIMITALLACVPIVYIIYKYSYPYEMGIFLYVMTSYYTFSMNGIRQYAAAGILILGTKYLFSEKKYDFLKYLAFVLAAWLFHTSALVMIPIYFVVRRKSWTPFTTVLLSGTILATVLFDTFLPQFLGMLEDTDYSIYAQNGWFTSGQETGSNIIRVVVLMVPLYLAYVCKDKMEFIHGRRWDILVNISIINLAFYILSLYNWIFARFAIYTSIYPIIMTTWIIEEGFDPDRRRTLKTLCIPLYIVYFWFVRYSIIDYKSDLF